jgi:hypothetical protein
MNITNRAKNIIISPTTEWGKINGENTTLQQLITTYLIPLSLIGAIASFIGWGFVGISILGVHAAGSITWGIGQGIGYILHVVLGAIITTYVVDALAPTFKSEKNLARSAQLVIYSYTPSLIGAIFMLFPAASFLSGICALYGLYLIFVGLHTVKKTPDDQRIGYVVVTVLVLIAVYVIIGVIFGSIISSIWRIGTYQGY